MYGLDDLKSQLRVTDGAVECPVLGCDQFVARQRRRFVVDDRFICPVHGICISPTTWKYGGTEDNLLWTAPADLALLEAIELDKRESRMAFDNSEDAVTFNVFRYLERNPAELAVVLSDMAGHPVSQAELAYWSRHAVSGRRWSPLAEARRTFGEKEAQGSEPDLIVVAAGILVFIEAKLTSTNVTSAPRSGARKEYLIGADAWFGRVFQADWQSIAVTGRRYELMRFWLLGTWLAADLGLKFRLVSLLPARQRTPSRHEPFEDYLCQDDGARFRIWSWEDVRDSLARDGTRDEDGARLAHYWATKTIGYGSDRRLRPAFRHQGPA